MMLAAAVLIQPGEAPLIALTVVSTLIGAIVILKPLAQALARRLEGRSGPDPQLVERIGELESRVQQLEAQQARTLELEERVDFAERLLAQRREPEQLPRREVTR